MFKPKSSRLGEVGDKVAGDGTGQGEWGKLMKDENTVKTSRFILLSRQWNLLKDFN